MKQRKLFVLVLTLALALVLTAVPALAVSGSDTAKDGDYNGASTVSDSDAFLAADDETADETTTVPLDQAPETVKSTADQAYVLMNIPYDKFYEGEGVSGVDAVTSATLNKPRTGTLAGGSYHVNADGSDISGVIYPVLVTDASVLEGLNQITDQSSVDITVTNRGVATTTTYSGKDALFEAPSYSYYLLSDAPALYKTLSVDEAGSFSFSAVSGRATAVEGVTGSASYFTHHNNYVEIALSGLTLGENENVSAVIVTFDDGTVTALRHVDGIWRKTQIGWADGSDVKGKTITNVRYITRDQVIDCPVGIFVKLSPDSDISAGFKSASLLEVSGLPQDIINPLATIKDAEDNVIAAQAPVAMGTVTCEADAQNGTEYIVTVSSDNYTDMTASATYGVKTNEVSHNDPAHGSVSVSPAQAADGSEVTVTVTPEAGYKLDQLTVTDSSDNQLPLTSLGNGRYSFTMTDSPAMVQASFKPLEQYRDVADDAWYAEAVSYVTANGLMQGVGNNNFGPDQNLTRAMLATILYRASGSPAVDSPNNFIDLADNTWYTDAVIWANANGVVLGFGSDFRPDANVTREQIAAMLMRYAKLQGWDVSQRASLNGYGDQGSVSDWANENMQWAVATGLINGRGNATLAPRDPATRAEIALILQRFFEKYAN